MTARLTKRSGAVLALLVLVVTATAVPVAAQSSEDNSLQPDNTVIRVNVNADGSAEWILQTRTRLETEEDVEAFKQFQQEYRNNSTASLNAFESRMSSVVADAENATDREMRASNFSTSATIQEVPRRWGVVTFRFTWHGFAATDGGSLVVGDVFEGGWFLSEDDTFEMNAPDGYVVSDADPSPETSDNESVVWTGRVDFANGNPSATFTPQDGADAPHNDSGLPLGLLAGGALVTLAAIGGAVAWRRRTGDSSATGGTNTSASTSVKTDAERIIELLEENGGRMKQADIDAEFDWSKSKTSLVLSNMEEEGRIKKTRLGRENLVALTE